MHVTEDRKRNKLATGLINLVQELSRAEMDVVGMVAYVDMRNVASQALFQSEAVGMDRLSALNSKFDPELRLCNLHQLVRSNSRTKSTFHMPPLELTCGLRVLRCGMNLPPKYCCFSLCWK